MASYIAPSQIAERQLEYFADKRVLVIGEIEDSFPIELSRHCDKVTVFTSNYITYRSLQSSSKSAPYSVHHFLMILMQT
ncbi:ribosomal RNA small subunit methyltransferase C [Vibrio variabilis]|uniref:Ribosomal RNA small subunit methyltransferase C n=1 Tax=Vibrio variabilis TaxID=990271 RepID=A0ABQ0J5L2_9VIBR|nr:ribosomal RNA small subunit methyltransferase C [Vibrio variabilis]